MRKLFLRSSFKRRMSFFGFLVLILAILPFQLHLISLRQLFKSQAAAGLTTPPTVESFRTSFSTLLSNLGATKRIQLFGGGLVLSEFDNNNAVYAGHLGSFWAPPFYSSHTDNFQNNSNEWQKGFNTGVVFYNYGYNGGATEQPSDPATEAFWYPSKIVMTHFYPGCGAGLAVRSAKVALPGVRGLALKFTITQQCAVAQQMGIEFLSSVPTLQTLRQWDSGVSGWNWLLSPSKSIATGGYYDAANRMLVVQDPGNYSYLAFGLSQPIDSYGMDDNYSGNNYNYNLYNYFKNINHGHLDNGTVYHDSSGNGSTVGLVAKSPLLYKGMSYTVTLIMGSGSSVAEAENIVRMYQSPNADVEAAADAYWNKRLNQAFSSVGVFASGDDTLNRIYQNAVLTYLVNRWDTYNQLSNAAGFGQSLGLYTWLTGDSSFLSMADPPFWKSQLINLLKLDYTRCRAYNPMTSLCDKNYSYSITSLVDAVYRYVTNNSDFPFLYQVVTTPQGPLTVYQTLKNLVSSDDRLEDPSDHLVNYGSDNKIGEYNIDCYNNAVRGLYTGKVISPNAERVVIHREMSELAGYASSTSDAVAYSGKADQLQSAIQKLWNAQAGFFNSISLYNPDLTPRTTPYTNTLISIWPYTLFQYDGLLTVAQVQAMERVLETKFGNINGSYLNYKYTGYGKYGFNSLSTDYLANWCDRSDWHGPGLYSGEAGVLLTGLFRQGYQDFAYKMLNPSDGSGYAYLAKMPYFSQSFPSWVQGYSAYPPYQYGSNHEGQAVAYLEGVSLAQTLIEGMMGVKTDLKLNQTTISPHVPQALLNLGPVSLNNFKLQTHLWSLVVNSTSNQNLTMGVSVAVGGLPNNHTRFQYTMRGSLTGNIYNLLPNTNFAVIASPVSGGSSISCVSNSGSSGNILFKFNLNGSYNFSIFVTGAPVSNCINIP